MTRRTWWAAALALSVLSLAETRPALAFGTPTYIIYVDGPNGGTIEASGDALPLPDGACGMRLLSNNVLAWYWAEGYAYPTGELNVENNGWMPPANQLTELIEFTGPFGGDCEGEYVFHTPATPTSEPPPGAVALVVQFVDPDDVLFLDFNFQVWEPPDPPDIPEPEDPDDICEEVPEFCEIPGSFVEDPCNSNTWHELCEEAESLGGLAFGIGHVVEPEVLGLSALAGTSSDATILKEALVHASKATAFEPMIKNAQVSLVGRAGRSLASKDAQRWLGLATVAAQLGTRDVLQCRTGLERALRLTTTATVGDRTTALAESHRAKATCAAAAATLSDAHTAATRFTIGLRNER